MGGDADVVEVEQPSQSLGEDREQRIENVHQRVHQFCGTINAAHAELVQLNAVVVEEQIWNQPGIVSPAHWLRWQAGLGVAQSEALVRLAAQLSDLTHPTIPARLRDRIEHRDRWCPFPGCRRRRSRGPPPGASPTGVGPSNRTSSGLCSRHHHDHHRGEFAITGDPTRPRACSSAADTAGSSTLRPPIPLTPNPRPGSGDTHPATGWTAGGSRSTRGPARLSPEPPVPVPTKCAKWWNPSAGVT